MWVFDGVNGEILLDTTVGVGILYVFLKLLHRIAIAYSIEDIETGVYGDPIRISAWGKQLGIGWARC
jgi:hypothetical protein